MNRWLLKTEPECYSWDDLVRDKRAVWDGVSNALALKHILPRPPRGFPLDNIREVIQAAGAQAPVIGVHVDSEDEAEVCYIGRLASVDDDGFYMQELSPDAEWMREVSFFGWDEVSTVSIEDSYAQSLLAVAGPAPELLAPGSQESVTRIE